MAEPAILTDQLAKSYDGTVYALQDLSIEVPQGEVFGFLGPNGAGKTTTVKLLTGLLKPSKGSCSVLGIPSSLHSSEVHSVCGVMTESARMYTQMTGMENLVFFAQTAEMELPAAKARAEELLKCMDLWDARDKKLRAYSTGMAQRLSLARALVNRPKVLFLDEPTSGLDPESAQAVNTLIDGLARKEGVTVFLCTHQLRYAQDICERYGIIEKGNLLACGTLETLSQNAQIHIRAALRLAEGDAPENLQRGKDGWWRTDLQHEDDMPRLLKQLIDGGNSIYEAHIVRPTLEDIYFRYVQANGQGAVS